MRLSLCVCRYIYIYNMCTYSKGTAALIEEAMAQALHVSVCVCMYVCMNICIYAFVFVCVYIYIICIHTVKALRL